MMQLFNAIVFQESHIMGCSHDEPSKPAITKRPVMIVSMMGAPAVVRRLIPVYFVKHNFFLIKPRKDYI